MYMGVGYGNNRRHLELLCKNLEDAILTMAIQHKHFCIPRLLNLLNHLQTTTL